MRESRAWCGSQVCISQNRTWRRWSRPRAGRTAGLWITPLSTHRSHNTAARNKSKRDQDRVRACAQHEHKDSVSQEQAENTLFLVLSVRMFCIRTVSGGCRLGHWEWLSGAQQTQSPGVSTTHSQNHPHWSTPPQTTGKTSFSLKARNYRQKLLLLLLLLHAPLNFEILNFRDFIFFPCFFFSLIQNTLESVNLV